MDIGLSLGRCRAEHLPNPRNDGYQQDEADILEMARRGVGPGGCCSFISASLSCGADCSCGSFGRDRQTRLPRFPGSERRLSYGDVVACQRDGVLAARVGFERPSSRSGEMRTRTPQNKIPTTGKTARHKAFWLHRAEIESAHARPSMSRHSAGAESRHR